MSGSKARGERANRGVMERGDCRHVVKRGVAKPQGAPSGLDAADAERTTLSTTSMKWSGATGF